DASYSPSGSEDQNGREVSEDENYFTSDSEAEDNDREL
ncbi:hypothetical protein AC249_AIPGENE21911, partial [Exaiptasia diaphana]